MPIIKYIGICKKCEEIRKLYSTAIGLMCRNCIDEEVDLDEFADDPIEACKKHYEYEGNGYKIGTRKKRPDLLDEILGGNLKNG